MHVVYATEPFPDRFDNAVFLAGPTPRDPATPSWRPDALDALRKAGYQGHVFVPEPRDGVWHNDYTGQIHWEDEGLELADVIGFWVPRELTAMPAFTTNVEFGEWVRSGKAVFGAPPDAANNRYLIAKAEKFSVPLSTTLDEFAAHVIAACGPPAPRCGAERHVPARLWSTASFQSWYQALVRSGHDLLDGTLHWQLTHEGHGEPFLWAFQPTVRIAGENRVKGGDVVIGRPDMSAVVAYGASTLAAARAGAASMDDVPIVLVEEFRAACHGGRVLETPSGSSTTESDPRMVAVHELSEEAGVTLEADDLVEHPARQSAATLATHRTHVFSVGLDDATIERLSVDTTIRGLAHDGERTTVAVRRVGDLRRNPAVDLATLAMVLDVIMP